MDAIYLNGFSFELLTKNGTIEQRETVEKIIYKDSNYYTLPNLSEYEIRLGNDNNIRVDVHIWINNHKVGTWRINPYSRIVIYKPINSIKNFRLISKFGIKSHLIKAIFKPELQGNYDLADLYKGDFFKREDQTIYPYHCNIYTDTVSPEGLNRHCAYTAKRYLYGLTENNYTNTSSYKGDCPRYIKVNPLKNIDKNKITIIYSRLIVDDDYGTYRRNYLLNNKANNISIAPPNVELINPLRPIQQSFYFTPKSNYDNKCLPYKYSNDNPFTLSKKYYFDNF